MLLQRRALLLAPASARAWEEIASTYDREIFQINESGRTANGEHFKPMGLTAAIWDVPFNTRLQVTHLATGRSILVRVNDRGPHRRLGWLIDLSTGSCQALSACGLARVRVEIVGSGRRVADAH